MENYSVVDIGTNSARLMVAHVAGKSVVSDHKTLRTIRVGEGMVQNKSIGHAAMLRTKDALLEYLEISKQYGVDKQHFLCFATSAVRDAGNKDAFIKYIKEECGILIEVISGETEASLGFAGSVQGTGGMFDIGGGSTEVMIGSLEDVWYQHSFKIGTVRLLQMFPEGDDADPDAFVKAHRLASDTFGPVPQKNEVLFIGIGGTATALVAIDLQLKEYDAAQVQGHEISIERAQQLCKMLKSKTKQQRKNLIGLEENKADVIVFGSIIMLEFMQTLGLEKIVVSDRDNQEGYLAFKLGLL